MLINAHHILLILLYKNRGMEQINDVYLSSRFTKLTNLKFELYFVMLIMLILFAVLMNCSHNGDV